jgi:hypothetical protein
MNSSTLVLLGVFDALIAIIQSDREGFCKSFDPDGAVQTLKKIQGEFVQQFLESTCAHMHATDTLRATIEQLLAGLPQGSHLEPLMRSLHLTVVTLLPQGPTPAWPSSSSSKSPFGFSLEADITQLIASLQKLTGQKLTQ